MSRRRVYHKETVEIMKRFYTALDDLVASGRVEGGLSGFCKKYGLDKRHLYLQRQDLGRGFFETYWILPLISDFGISQFWMLFGVGSMYAGGVKNS